MISSIALALSLLVNQEFARLPDFDHSQNWRSLETPHFYIHFLPGLSEPAYRLSELVEPVRTQITSQFKHEPEDKVHIILSDAMDDSNGLSTPIPYNAIYLYVAPPTADSALDYYDDWLRMLFTHEFTHTVHIDQVVGINKFIRMILGRAWVPNAAQQQWAIEGIAELEETDKTSMGRGRSPFVTMFLRTVSLEKSFLDIDRATYWHDRYPYGNAAYYYGIGFYQYLVKKYGRDKITKLTQETSDALVPAFFNFTTNDIFGKSFSRLWAEWRQEEEQKWSSFAQENKTKPAGKPLLNGEYRLEGAPVFSPDGKTLYAGVMSPEFKPELRAFTWDSDAKVKSEKLADGPTPSKLTYFESASGNFLLYHKSAFVSPYQTYNDIFAFDLQNKKPIRLTRGLRLRDPVPYQNGIVAVRTNALRSSIIYLPLPQTIDEKNDPVDHLKGAKTLFEAVGYDTLSSPAISPDQKTLYFSMRKENRAGQKSSRHLYSIDLDSKKVFQITDGPYEEHSPTLSQDGLRLYFQSARPLNESQSEVWVPNIYVLELSSMKTRAVTESITGTSWPVVSDSRMALGVYRSFGFELNSMKLPSPASRSQEIKESEKKPYQAGSNPIAKKPESYKETSYKMADSLLPHYLFPFFFFTESNSAFGVFTGSYDPLQIHSWSAGAYFLTGPSRPGGFGSYTYNFRPYLNFTLGLSAGITDYGYILIKQGSGINLFSDPYYERNFNAYFMANSRFYGKKGYTGLGLSLGGVYERRLPLLGIPSNAATRFADPALSHIKFLPEEGVSFGPSLSLSYATPSFPSPQAESPASGLKISASSTYLRFSGSSDALAPSKDRNQLFSSMNAKVYYSPADGHYFGLMATWANQWLSPLYQHSYLLGGSFGEGPFTSVNKRNYPLRGLDVSALQGEGLISGSFEYRLGLFRQIKGFGTAPVWFKNLHLGFFTDVGQTYQAQTTQTAIEYLLGNGPQDYSNSRFTESIGAELRSHISVTYAPPLLFRLGYARLVFLEGESVIGNGIDQVYFQMGASF